MLLNSESGSKKQDHRQKQDCLGDMARRVASDYCILGPGRGFPLTSDYRAGKQVRRNA